MRNLFLFLTKNYYFFLFLFLESVAVLLLIRNNNYQRAGFINSSNAISGRIYEAWTGMTDYLNLKHSNDLLVEENAMLRNKLKNSLEDYSMDQTTISDSGYKQKYTFIPAKVVNNSCNRRNNYLTLNRGSAQGIHRLMGVISSEGVVGIVQEVSENFCTVRSVLHMTMKVPSMIRKYRENSMVYWDGEDNTIARMDNVTSNLKIVKGDTVVTSNYSSVFPAGIMVGTVEEIVPIKGNTFNNLSVRLSTGFNKLSYVYIVNNILQQEQEDLEKKTSSGEKQQ